MGAPALLFSTGSLFFLTIGPTKMQIRALGVITKLTTADSMNRLNKTTEKRYVTNQMAV